MTDDRRFAEVSLQVNGEPRTLRLGTRTTLLDALRDHLGLTGSTKGCDHGRCGARTVLTGGRRRLSCLALTVAHDGARVRDLPIRLDELL